MGQRLRPAWSAQSYHGTPLSEHAELYLDTSGLGRILALTADEHPQCARLYPLPERLRGQERVCALEVGSRAPARTVGRDANAMATGRGAFAGGELRRAVTTGCTRGAEVRRTNLSEAFTIEKFREVNGDRAVPLFALDPKAGLEVFNTAVPLEPGPGPLSRCWTRHRRANASRIPKNAGPGRKEEPVAEERRHEERRHEENERRKAAEAEAMAWRPGKPTDEARTRSLPEFREGGGALQTDLRLGDPLGEGTGRFDASSRRSSPVAASRRRASTGLRGGPPPGAPRRRHRC